MLISVVVPIYNVAQFLPDFIAGLTALPADDTQFVFVDDCSTDDSLAEAKRLIEAHRLGAVTFISHTVNRGLSAARNTGLTAATGDYVWFLDSDDALNTEFVPHLISTLRQDQPDIAMFDFMRFHVGTVASRDEDGHLQVIHPSLHVLNHARRSTIPGLRLGPADLPMATILRDRRMHVWSYCFRRSHLPESPFPEGRVYEDISTVPALIHSASSLIYLPYPIVLYRTRDGSVTTHTATPKPQLDLANAMSIGWRRLTASSPPLSPTERAAFFGVWLQTLVWSIGTLQKRGFMGKTEVIEAVDRSVSGYRQAVRWKERQLALRALRRPEPHDLQVAKWINVVPFRWYHRIGRAYRAVRRRLP